MLQHPGRITRLLNIIDIFLCIYIHFYQVYNHINFYNLFEGVLKSSDFIRRFYSSPFIVFITF